MVRLETSSIKELPELHRMGHTCVNLNGDLFFVWGGTDENTAYVSALNTHLWIYETLTGYWRHRSCSGECPPYLSGTTSCLIGQKMFVFGGHSTAQDNWLNSLYCLDLDTFVWQDLGSQARAEPTKPIRSDKNVSWSHNGRLYVFGGYGWSQTEHLLQLLDRQKDLQLTPDYRWPKFGWNNQLVEFDPRDNTWRWPSYSGKCPSARAAHSGALMGNRYYLFGGRDSRERLNDLYTFDMETLQWNQIAVFSDPTGPNLERLPIRHLLEPPSDDDDSDDEDDEEAVAEDLIDPEAAAVVVVLQEEIREAEAAEEVEPLTPSPSSSTQPAASAAHFIHQESLHALSSDEDEPDYEFEYPHPSHLLERWSLSSNQSVSGSSNILIDANADCQLPHCSQTQMLSQPDSFTCSSSIHPHHHYLHHQSQHPSGNQMDGPSQTLDHDHELVPEENNNQDMAPGELVEGAAIDTPGEGHEPAAPAPVPVGRSFSSFTPISDQDILLYGGVSSQDDNLSDCWLFNTKANRWTQIDLKVTKSRLWHTAARTKNNEVVVMGGSSSDKIDEFCADVLTIALEPKSLKRSALDTAAKCIRMRSINRIKGLPSNVCKLIKLRKQAMALSTRRHPRPAATVQAQPQ